MSDIKEQLIMGGDVEGYLQNLRRSDLDFVAEYFELVLEDYQRGQFPSTEDGRYWEVSEETDISRLIDLAIMFGVEWEKDSKYD